MNSESRPIYLDYNATTPIDPAVSEAMKPFAEAGPDSLAFGNPSSSHAYGQHTKEAVEEARRKIAGLINADSEQIVFTSGGSESNNTAIKCVQNGTSASGGHIITTQIEHPSVLEPCRYRKKQGWDVTELPVDEEARVNPEDVREALREETVLVSVMLANNEVGTLQPLEEIGDILRNEDVLLHTDAAQAVGKVPVDVEELGVDLMTIAGHKVYAPKGVGALYRRDPDTIRPLVHGAGHEGGLRAGTENVILDVGLGKACEIADPEQEQVELEALREDLHDRLRDVFGDRIQLNGPPQDRLPNTLNVSFHGIEGDELLEEAGSIAASTGAACHEGGVELSSVLQAMGVDPDVGKGAVRLSLGRFTTEDDLRAAAESLEEAYSVLRS